MATAGFVEKLRMSVDIVGDFSFRNLPRISWATGGSIFLTSFEPRLR